MKLQVPIILLMLSLIACENQNNINSLDPINWQNKRIQLIDSGQIYYESSYLSIYSQIYERNQKVTFDLTVTVSMRNKSSSDSIYILKADYYNTSGSLIRTYFDFPILLKPMETIEIVIDQVDSVGGTGGNFIFSWATENQYNEPLFEAIMISTDNQQGISFTTQGVKR
ncbi:MAG: DUF3124 domain-containing protein [Ignavibacteriae bacterium]|nr:DUF3124 domain-containing protein [Ignavibacteriota bacterium]